MRPDPGPERLGGALLASDRRRRSAGDAGRRGDVRRDVAEADRGRPGPARSRSWTDDDEPRWTGRSERSSTASCSTSAAGSAATSRSRGSARTASRSARTATSTSTCCERRAPRDGERVGPRHHRRHVLHRPVGTARPGRPGGGHGRRRLQRGLPLLPGAASIVGRHVPVTALRLSYVGELGWELYTTGRHGSEAVGHAVGGRPMRTA